MKRMIILLLLILLCGWSAEKTAETLLSVQNEPMVSKTTVADTSVTDAEPKSKMPETVRKVKKDESTVSSVYERPQEKTSSASQAPIEMINEETKTAPSKTLKTPVETSKEDKPKGDTANRRNTALERHRAAKSRVRRQLLERLCKVLRAPNWA